MCGSQSVNPGTAESAGNLSEIQFPEPPPVDRNPGGGTQQSA